MIAAARPPRLRTKALRSPAKVHGGKGRMARRYIIPALMRLMPEPETYCEPCVGGGSVLLNLPIASREFAADIDPEVIHFWKMAQAYPDALIQRAMEIPYTQESWDIWSADPSWRNPVDQALAFMVRHRFSQGGRGTAFAWSDRCRGGQPGDANAWDTCRKQLPDVIDRVRNACFANVPACDLIHNVDSPTTLHYVDPPYLPSTRTARKVYRHEMTRAQHVELLGTLAVCKGAVAISGYRSTLYDECLQGWERLEFALPNNAAHGATKQRRTECLWLKRAGQ